MSRGCLYMKMGATESNDAMKDNRCCESSQMAMVRDSVNIQRGGGAPRECRRKHRPSEVY